MKLDKTSKTEEVIHVYISIKELEDLIRAKFSTTLLDFVCGAGWADNSIPFNENIKIEFFKQSKVTEHHEED